MTSASGAQTMYQVLGSTSDGANLVFESAQGSGSNTGPYYILANSGTFPGNVALNYSSNNVYYPVCFSSGTMLATVRGPVAIEDMAIGDICLTASGGTRAVVWIGSTCIHASRRPRPEDVYPVVVARGALASNVPSRDLLVSPGHRLLIDGKLFPAITLVNGASIVQKAVETIGYYHVELDVPDALMAEGVAAESYVDVGNRIAFSDAVGHPSAPP